VEEFDTHEMEIYDITPKKKQRGFGKESGENAASALSVIDVKVNEYLPPLPTQPQLSTPYEAESTLDLW
jgi:hypothetical protein